MNPTPDLPRSEGANAASGATGPASPSLEETLRLLAHAPVPEGLEGRMHAALRSAPRRTRVLAWPGPAGEPSAAWLASSWMRTAAAAAIVFVVAGGGWGVYMRVQRPAPKVIVMPAAQPAAGGGFSSAGAMRTPPTAKGPMLHSVVKATAAGAPAANPTKLKAHKKTAVPGANPGTKPAAGAVTLPATGAEDGTTSPR